MHWFSGLTGKWLLYGSDLCVHLTRRKIWSWPHCQIKWKVGLFLLNSTEWTFLTLFSGTWHPAGAISLLADRRAKTASWKHRAEDGRFALQVKEEIINSCLDKTISFSPCWSDMQWRGVKIIHTILCSWIESKLVNPSREYYFYRPPPHIFTSSQLFKLVKKHWQRLLISPSSWQWCEANNFPYDFAKLWIKSTDVLS